jgi:hypothetical protein
VWLQRDIPTCLNDLASWCPEDLTRNVKAVVAVTVAGNKSLTGSVAKELIVERGRFRSGIGLLLVVRLFY